MTPHLHTSKSAFGEMGASNSQTNKIENTERAITTNGRAPHIDPHIHTADIMQFAKFGFEEKVERLANHSDFQPSMIQDVYKHSSTFKQAENIAKAMQVAAVRCAVSKINRQVMPNSDGEDGDSEEDEEEEEEEGEKKENKEGKNKDKHEKKNKGKDVKDIKDEDK